ncbi:hypothetical protein G3M48_000925 [Beauveria asiatica]|uniref:SAP domain-containing protein n=1 Tax=Beauveria asiatica TaxID=1069075 RepID=A0AAW0RFW8_9HYPO
MADYASLKVPELKKLLAERKLPQTGNKADLVARLQEEDSKLDVDSEAKPAAKDDEITYSDDEGAKPATAAPADATEAAPAAPAAPVPAAAAASTDATADAAAPAKGDAVAAEPAEPAAPPPSFVMGLSSTTAEEEAKKRANRAKRFGIEEDDEDFKKRAERTARFGLEDKDVSSLDAALPERPLKRGRGQNQDGHRPGKRQSTDRRGNDRRNGRHGRQGGGGGGNAQARGSRTLIDPVEKAKAEQRAARFAAA